MKTILHLGVAALLLAGCHRGGSSMQREQQQYDVVQEGQASGVTSTINAPGDTPAPITNTNADTTTAFAGFGNGAPTTPTTAQPGTLGSTLPPVDYSRDVAAAPPRPVTRAPRPSTPQQQAPPPMTSAQPAPPPSDDDTSTAPPTQTDTTNTTTTRTPQPEVKPEPKPEPPPQPQPEPPQPQPEPQPPQPSPPTNT